MNTTSLSRELANGKREGVNSITGYEAQLAHAHKSSKPNLTFLFALTRTYAIIISRWGGGGGRDIVNRYGMATGNTEAKARATEICDPMILRFLNVLSFSTMFVQAAWALMQSNQYLMSDLQDLLDAKKRCVHFQMKSSTCIHQRSHTFHIIRAAPLCSVNFKPSVNRGRIDFDQHNGAAFLLVFNMAFAHALIVTDDAELHELESPLPMHHIRRYIHFLKSLLYRACCSDQNRSDGASRYVSNHAGFSLISSSAKIMRDLYSRSSRRLLCAPKLWLVDDLLDEDIRRCKSYEDYCALLDVPVLRLCPFLVSFKRRLKLFERITDTNRESIQGRNDGHSFRYANFVNFINGVRHIAFMSQ